MKLSIAVNVINLFLYNLCPKQQNLIQNLRQYVDRSVTYVKNVLLKWALGVKVIKLSSA
jgi:hypothetical protein